MATLTRIRTAAAGAAIGLAVFTAVRVFVTLQAPELALPGMPGNPTTDAVVAHVSREPSEPRDERVVAKARPAASTAGRPILVAAPAPGLSPKPKATPKAAVTKPAARASKRRSAPSPAPAPAPTPRPAPAPAPAPEPDNRTLAVVSSLKAPQEPPVKESPGREKRDKGPAPGQLKKQQKPQPQPRAEATPGIQADVQAETQAVPPAEDENREHPHGGPPGQAKKDK